MSNPAPTANGLKRTTQGVLHEKYAGSEFARRGRPKGVEAGIARHENSAVR